jgi:hypothetical protein
MALGHCEIEERDKVDPLAVGLRTVPLIPAQASFRRSGALRVRALQLCRAGDFARARRVLLFLSNFDSAIGVTFTDSFVRGKTEHWEKHLECSTEDPGFLAVDRWSEADVVATKERFQGFRVLLVVPWNTPYAIGDRYFRSASVFGLAARTLGLDEVLGIFEPVPAAARLQQEIDRFEPEVILISGLAELLNTPKERAVEESLSAVLVAARQRGVRVVASFSDAWRQASDSLTKGLGSAFDLIHHTHPALGRLPALSVPNVWCYFHPTLLPPPTISPRAIPRAVTVGGVTYANPARIVWWVQIGLSDLPIDVVETQIQGDGMLSPQDYANLLCGHEITVGLTRRASGMKIITARTIETLLVGGVLVEEDCFDTRYFLKPGEHYVPFNTWGDLGELIPWLLNNREHREALARAGRAWAERHFSGDWFWTGLLRRVFAVS